jgi:magnesium transporter
MSEFTAMTAGVPMPVAYGLFVLGAGGLGLLTYRAVRRLDRSKAARSGSSGG